jgi:hypothetical protein
MKNTLVTIIVAAVFTWPAVSMADQNPKKLPDPNNLDVTSKADHLLFVWDYVKNAQKYIVEIQGNAEYDQTGREVHYTVEVEFTFECPENPENINSIIPMKIKIQRLFDLVAKELKKNGFSSINPGQTSLKQGTAKVKALAKDFLDSDYSAPVQISDIYFKIQ